MHFPNRIFIAWNYLSCTAANKYVPRMGNPWQDDFIYWLWFTISAKNIRIGGKRRIARFFLRSLSTHSVSIWYLAKSSQFYYSRGFVFFVNEPLLLVWFKYQLITYWFCAMNWMDWVVSSIDFAICKMRCENLPTVFVFILFGIQRLSLMSTPKWASPLIDSKCKNLRARSHTAHRIRCQTKWDKSTAICATVQIEKAICR